MRQAQAAASRKRNQEIVADESESLLWHPLGQYGPDSGQEWRATPLLST